MAQNYRTNSQISDTYNSILEENDLINGSFSYVTNQISMNAQIVDFNKVQINQSQWAVEYLYRADFLSLIEKNLNKKNSNVIPMIQNSDEEMP